MESGTKLGHYEIREQIGAGGMGEVYRATDTKLKRDVAVKVLPSDFASDPERLARFQREAEVLASLNHPNIAAIYGLEDAGDTKALVMELVEGPTLADRIAQGAIPVDEALPIAKQIAEALEAAHEQGIIHRDLKLANVKVKHDGTVKVLDFGLAKAMNPVGDPTSVSQSPTLSMAATQAGIILGTAAYMSPEQAKGRTVDKRTDVWAFGAVLYEMLTGELAFQADDVSDTLAAILRAEVNWSVLPKELSPTIQTYLKRCLERDTKQRVQDIGDVRLVLEGAFETPVRLVAEGTGWVQPGWKQVVLVVAPALLVGLVVWNLRPAPAAPGDVIRFYIDTPELSFLGLGSSADPNLVISPSGDRIVYLNRANIEDDPTGGGQLYVRRLDELEAALLPGTAGSRNPFISTDGQWLGFIQGNVFKRTSILGGPAVSLAEVPAEVRGATWTDDGIIIGSRVGLLHVPAEGGEPEPLTETNRLVEQAHAWPNWIPDANAVFFVVESPLGETRLTLAVLDLGSGDVKRLELGGSYPHYIEATGHLIWVAEDGSLLAANFNAETLELEGSFVPLLSDVAVNNRGAASFSVSTDGHLAYASGTNARGSVLRNLAWVDREGRAEVLPFAPRAFNVPRLSTDGTHVAVDDRDPFNNDVWVGELARGTLSRLTTNQDVDSVPWWTLDGRRVVFSSIRGSSRGVGLFSRAFDGSGEVEELARIYDLVPTPNILRGYAWSPDGNSAVFVFGSAETRRDLGVLELGEDTTWRPLLETEADESHPALSPDGRWLAYTSDVSGRPEVYMERFLEMGDRRLVSVGGGHQPVWSPLGNELFYRSSTPEGPVMMVVPVEIEPTFELGTAEVMFPDVYDLREPDQRRTYDVAPDGQSFLMVTQPLRADGTDGMPQVNTINIVLNWTQELLERVPVD